jgi:hypothetical protein
VSAHTRECARCQHVLVDEDELGWYYQVPVTDPEFPGLTFAARVHDCDGKPHDVRPRGELLALHLVSIHCDPMAIARSYDENVDMHDHEHKGPGTIRNHDPAWLGCDAAKAEDVLEEAEAADAADA